MQKTSRVRDLGGRSPIFPESTENEYSQFVDRINAQRFKTMVGRADNPAVTSEQKLGIPFAIERPEAAAAHRELERELKPAAREEMSLIPRGAAAGAGFAYRGGSLAVTVLGLLGLAITVARSLK